MHAVLVALGIFCLRILDVSIGTVRMIYTFRGQRLISLCLGVIESGVWIFAISRAFKYVDNPLSMIGWATGFGTGTAVGITLEKWIASGSIIMRCISRDKAMELRDALLQSDFGVTLMPGEGRDGKVFILFIVSARKRTEELLRLVHQVDPQAFVTIDSVNESRGGYVPITATSPASVKK